MSVMRLFQAHDNFFDEFNDPPHYRRYVSVKEMLVKYILILLMVFILSNSLSFKR